MIPAAYQPGTLAQDARDSFNWPRSPCASSSHLRRRPRTLAAPARPVPPHHRAPVTASCRESFARDQDHHRGQPVSIPAPLAPESTRSRAAGKRPPFRFSCRHWCSGRPEPRYPFAVPARTFSTHLQTRGCPAAVHPRAPFLAAADLRRRTPCTTSTPDLNLGEARTNLISLLR